MNKDLILILLITIFLLITTAAIYTIKVALTLLPLVLIIFIVLKYLGIFRENFEVNINYNTSDYNQATCYNNGNRPFVINSQDLDAFSGSTAHCVMKGGPISWKQPIWELPVSDPRNPAYYNEFPSQML
jgi:hypothetical protein